MNKQQERAMGREESSMPEYPRAFSSVDGASIRIELTAGPNWLWLRRAGALRLCLALMDALWNPRRDGRSRGYPRAHSCLDGQAVCLEFDAGLEWQAVSVEGAKVLLWRVTEALLNPKRFADAEEPQ